MKIKSKTNSLLREMLTVVSLHLGHKFFNTLLGYGICQV
jgi:hypothetical protein